MASAVLYAAQRPYSVMARINLVINRSPSSRHNGRAGSPLLPSHMGTMYTHATDLRLHDPSIIHVDDTLDGPWKHTGTVLDADSVIPKGDRKAPWAPQTIRHGDTYYCFYSVSLSGCRDSAIGVATSKSPGPGGWTDHGLLVQSGTGKGSGEHPFNSSNTIDPSALVGEDGQGYLMFGSFWSGIWQVPLDQALISVAGDTRSEARQLVYMEEAPLLASNNPNPLCQEPSGARPIEGSFVSYHEPWYYVWFSYGKCCKFDTKESSFPRKRDARLGYNPLKYVDGWPVAQ